VTPDDQPKSEVADLAERVREALRRTEIMALSTIGPDGPWTSPVQYQHNDKLELFFASQADTKHGANIKRDPRVAVAIYNSPGPSGGNLGLQVKGHAHVLSDEPDGGGWLRYKITPEKVWCFDSRVFGGRRQRVSV
jgi:general stress protein 26